MNSPNKITAADFKGWVQERGLYFPNKWDAAWTPILSCNDPGEKPLDGGLLVAKSGSGYFIYTGHAWFRQLPAGVPGAYRLFANMVSLRDAKVRSSADFGALAPEARSEFSEPRSASAHSGRLRTTELRAFPENPQPNPWQGVTDRAALKGNVHQTADHAPSAEP